MQEIQWTRCPQCDQIAVIVDRDVWPSTDGPVEHVHVRCVRRHRFVMPVASLAHEGDASSVTAAGGRVQGHRTSLTGPDKRR